MAAKHVNYIITAKHLSGTGKPRDWLLKLKQDIEQRRGIKIKMRQADTAASPVYARIYRGHWIADCDVCNGAMFVDPDDPLFFCLECFNRRDSGKMRPIVFPDDRQEIEQAILERPVNDFAGVTDSERAGRAFIEAGGMTFTRDWVPGETAKDIRTQNSVIDGLKRKRRK